MINNTWAIVMIVHSENFSLIFFYINSSVSKSTLAVASSKIKILSFLNNVLAKHINYFCPIENTDELLAIL